MLNESYGFAFLTFAFYTRTVAYKMYEHCPWLRIYIIGKTKNSWLTNNLNDKLTSYFGTFG